MKYLLPILIFALSACSLTSPEDVTPSPPEKTESTITPVPAPVLAPAPVAPPTFTVARGTEPFWVVQFTATGATYLTPDPLGGIPISLDYTTTSTLSGSSTIIIGTPVATGSAWTLTLTPASCNDGMSEFGYSHNATMVMGTGSMTGCAN